MRGEVGCYFFLFSHRFGLNLKEQNKDGGPKEDSLPMAEGLELEGPFQVKSLCDFMIPTFCGVQALPYWIRYFSTHSACPQHMIFGEDVSY